jgi:serine/threonine-protein kinase
MRFIRGDSLKEAIEGFHADGSSKKDSGRQTLELRKLLRRFTDVCNALEYAHSRGVLHRDIKPGNIIVGKHGETLVVDWGLAKATGRSEPGAAERTLMPSSVSGSAETLPGTALGTPAYMSPEQAAGDLDRLGPRSDVYSLGATLYCLLTGKPPQEGDDIGEVLRKVQRGEFSPPRQIDPLIDPALEAICKKAMAIRPEDRYGSARALVEEVERWMADEPTSAWREPLSRRARRWGRRHRLLVTSLAAMLIAAVGALAVGNVLVARQRDIAERNLAFARRVVDEMYTGVAAKLEDQKEMDDYQREILEKALSFYERLALPQSRDPQVRLEAARAGMRVGGIRARLAETAAAERAYGQAIEVLNRLVSDRPAQLDSRDVLAQAHLELGAVFRTEERRTESEREVKEAAALWKALGRERPEFTEYRSKYADALGRLGDHYQIQGRVEEAKAALLQALDIADLLAREHPKVSTYQESLAAVLIAFSSLQGNRLHDIPGSVESDRRAAEIMEKLARDHPEMTKYQLGLGFNLGRLGHGLAVEGKFPPAEAAVKQAIAILEKLAADHPQDMRIAAALAETYWKLAFVLRARGDGQSAQEWSDRGIGALRLLARRDPHNRWSARTRLWGFLGERGENWTRLGRLTEALADFNEAIEIAHDNGNKEEELFRVFHVLTKARLGDLSALALLGDQARDVAEVGASHGQVTVYYYEMLSYDAACVHAALGQLALHDQARPPAERRQLADRDLERALDLLDKARVEGEFKGIRHDEIRKETLLNPLRSRPRFQLLMMDLEFPDEPFARGR